MQGQREQALYILRRGWLTLSETAAEVSVSRQTVRYWAKTAKIDYIKRRAVYKRKVSQQARRAIRRKNGIQKD